MPDSRRLGDHLDPFGDSIDDPYGVRDGADRSGGLDGHDDAADEDLLARLRPPPPRTWRDRLDDLLADPPPWGRVVAAIAVVACVAVVAVRMLVPPPAPTETDLPLAQRSAGGADAGATGHAPASPGAGDGSAGAVAEVGGASGRPSTAGPASGGTAAGAGSPATPGEVIVHVVGAVASPGVQRLPAGARVADAVTAAGGAAADADLARVNLAAVLVDGQQVVILRPGEQPPVVARPPGGGPSAGAGSDETLVDINTASATELEELPGVGPTTAEAIVTHREQQGPFAAVDDLLDVRGIGEAKLEQIRAHATV